MEMLGKSEAERLAGATPERTRAGQKVNKTPCKVFARVEGIVHFLFLQSSGQPFGKETVSLV